MSVTIGNVTGGIVGSQISGGSSPSQGLLVIYRLGQLHTNIHLVNLKLTDLPSELYEGFSVVIVADQGRMRVLKNVIGTTGHYVDFADLQNILERYLLQ